LTSDAELLTKCLKGDRNAWEEIVRQHHQRIYNLAYRFTGRFDEAEDLTQEIFLKMYRTLHSYRPDSGAFGAWITRVARNHLVDDYRKHRTERTKTDSLEVEHERVATNPSRYASPSEVLERQETSDRIHHALLRLSEDLREAVVLRDLEELSYEEIAVIVDAPLGTVKSRINRGRIELAKALRREI
jgi:RNA polymerase sigma factor (sigma-70 family)